MLGLWANIARLTRFSVPLRLEPHVAQQKQRTLHPAELTEGAIEQALAVVGCSYPAFAAASTA